MKSENRKHIIFWLCYVVFEIYVEYAYLLRDFKQTPWYEVVWISTRTESLLLLLKIPLAYVVVNSVHNLVENQKKVFGSLLRIFFSYAIAIAIYVYFVFNIVYPLIYKLPVSEDDTLGNRSLMVFLDLTFAAVVFFAVFQYFQHQKWKLKERELVNERIVAELNLIKAQTNPHFLFNTLNSLYALARKNSPDTQHGILKLSNLLRYLLYEASANAVLIKREINVIQDYIELEQLRWGNKVDVKFSIAVDCENTEIIPSILLQLVENAFKHGAGESRFNSFIFIDLRLSNEFLQFTIRNSAEEEKPKSENSLGLKNLKRLIDLSYSDYHFNCELLNNEFLVELNIALDAV
ncbi:MAG: sensor histidine kinase, partial [Ferruginibacter sp.]